MGNRQGHNKEASKPKEDKQNEKDAQKGKKNKETTEKRKKQLGHKVLDPETDFDESSHVTGGDSESCVFHSAENISFSPYLDSSTRSEHEQSTAWSGVLEQAASGAQHPYVLSSKDFQDGFSLEACIPSEIARLEDYNDVSSKSRYGHRNPSLNSSTASKSPAELKASFSGPHSSATGENCSNISATSSPLAGTTEGHKVHLSPKSTPTQKGIKTESQEKQPQPTSGGQHHPHFYNHNRTKQHPSPLPVIKPTSPQPQRRTLTPKISSPFKTTTSESPSPAPSTPGPQRRAANFLALFRSSSKRGKAAANEDEDSKTDSTSDEARSRSYTTGNDSDRKVKSKPTWKTWERPRSKKSKKLVKDSIFGTCRKSDNKTGKGYTEDITQVVAKEESSGAAVAATGHLLELGADTSITERENQHKLTYAALTTHNHNLSSAASPSLEAKSNNEKISSVESEQVIRACSPPLSTTAAVCILKLEELERSIEKTIREKFPDVEPFLIKQQSKEELHGSRSLPATPSNKKKLHLVGDEGTHLVGTKLKNIDVTRFYNETYESPPSPSSSPIVLRRFGARTRHASISPKMQRAKTAALFNSPGEMSSFGAPRPTPRTPQVPLQHRLSSDQSPRTPQVPLQHRLSSDQAAHSEMPKISAAQKSESKYDNVIGDEDTSTPLCNQDNYYPHRHDQLKDNNREEVDEASLDESSKDGRDQSQMIIPTFSAVFGSVSPKLRRHLQVKFDETKDNVDENKTRLDENVQLPNHSNKNEASDTALKGSHATERAVTKTGFSSSPVGFGSSDIAPDLNQLKGKTLQEGSSEFAGQSEHKVNERGKKAQPHKDKYKASEPVGTASPADITRAINNSVLGLRATRSSDVEANCNDNTDPAVISPRHISGKPSNETGEETLISFEHRMTPPCAVSSHTTQPGEIHRAKITAKSGQLGSVATQRTHSTDRVLLFESAVCFPDRSHPIAPLSQASPALESTCSEKNSHIAQAQDIAPKHGHRYASKQNIVDNPQGETPHSQPTPASSLSSLRDRSLSDTVTRRETGRDLSQEEVAADISLQHRGCDFNGRTADGQELVISNSESDCVIFDRRDESKDSEACFSSVSSPKTVHVFCGSGTNANRLEEHHVNLRQKQDSAQLCNFYQDEERVSVFKQPVSEVISQMISRSKLQPQQQDRHLQQKQQQQQRQEKRLPPNITSHEHAAVQPQLVTVQKYEQLSEVLERKCVQVPAGPTTADFTDELRQSRCQEIQTDSYTTADKGVDSHELADTTGSFRFSKTFETGNSVTSLANSGQEVTEQWPTNGCSENEVVKMSDESKKNEIEGEDPSSMSEHVPPPSPTALQQLIEESEEEADDLEDEGEDIRALATTNREQLEIKEFSDTIYKRLSELLGNNPEDESDVESNHLSDNNEPEGLVSEKDGSVACETNSEIIACTNNDTTTRTETCASIQTGFPVSPLVKILTVDTSSSLTTTTSSESDLDDTSLMFHSFQNDETNNGGVFKNPDNYVERQEEESGLVFQEFDETNLEKPTDPDLKPASREYHSDDDVAKGRGIPDYYDDRPLWSRRQKPPGHLSAAMMAIRWRERRERWLKKRRRNRTDLMSTGSSDTGSEYCLNRHDEPADDNYFQYDRDHEKTKRTNDMGSGILTSPKYTKPILPFFDTQAGNTESQTTSHFHSSVHRRKRHDSRSASNRGGSSTKQSSNATHGHDTGRKLADANTKNNDTENGNMSARSSVGVKSGIHAASIEDTFQELMSVQTILKEMQECRCSVEDITEKQGLLPLTTENVRSIRDYYKDFYTSGNGRRSRMSATDRTESDLDLYSEIQDDASSESELYADDEGDDDGQEPYATAEDEAGAAGRGSSTSCRSNKRDEGRHDEEDDSDASLVLSCTFYNSNTHQQHATDTTAVGPTAIYSLESKPTHRSTSVPQAPTSNPNLNSDEEFWAGSAVIEESYKQLETAADAVSSTFQNAREQMHDIQYHLQALRRQMEVMQSDLTNVTLSLSESASTEHLKK